MQTNLAIQKLAAAISDAQDGNFVSLRKKDAIAIMRLLKPEQSSQPTLIQSNDERQQPCN